MQQPHVQQEVAEAPPRAPVREAAVSGLAGPLLALQRTAGNRAGPCGPQDE